MASGDTLIYLTATSFVPGDAQYATFDTILTASADTPDQVVPVLDFDPGATEEHTYAQCFMPRFYGGSGITATVGWSSETSAGAVVWSLAFKSVGDDTDDLDTKAFAAPQSITATTATAIHEVDYASIMFSNGAEMDSVAAGEYFMLELKRGSSVGGDDMDNHDAELHFIELKET